MKKTLMSVPLVGIEPATPCVRSGSRERAAARLLVVADEFIVWRSKRKGLYQYFMYILTDIWIEKRKRTAVAMHYFQITFLNVTLYV